MDILTDETKRFLMKIYPAKKRLEFYNFLLKFEKNNKKYAKIVDKSSKK